MKKLNICILLILLASLLTMCSAEQVEKLGPQLISEGSFLGSGGGNPPVPAAWEIESSQDASATWLEKGYRDKGCANLVATQADGVVSLKQHRWVSGEGESYLLSFFWMGKSVVFSAALSLIDEDGEIIASSRKKLSNAGYWKEERLFFVPFPAGIEGEIVTEFKALGNADIKIDHVSLTRYSGPFTEREKLNDGYLQNSPSENQELSGTYLFTWRAAEWAESYEFQVLDSKSVYHKATTKFNAIAFCPKLGESSWRVLGISKAGKKRTLLDSVPFVVKSAKATPQKAIALKDPPPLQEGDLEALKKNPHIYFFVEELLEGQIPSLLPVKLPQPYKQRLLSMLKTNASWETAANSLLKCSILSAAGVAEAKEMGTEIVNQMTSALSAGDHTLSSSAIALTSLAVISCCYSKIHVNSSKTVFEKIMPERDIVSSHALKTPGDLEWARLAAVNYIAMKYGVFGKDIAGIREAFIASSSYWFSEPTAIPSSVLAGDLPIFLSASELLARSFPNSQSLAIRQNVLASFQKLAYDFPMQARSSSGYSTLFADRKAASLLAYGAGSIDCKLPSWVMANSGEFCGFAGLYAATPKTSDSFFAGYYSQNAGFHQRYSPLLDKCGAMTFRASSFGTAYPFGASQGNFSFSKQGVPYLGLSPVFPSFFAESNIPIPSSLFQTFQSSRMSQEAQNYQTDAKITSNFSLGSCSIYTADLAPASPDFIRRANRTVVMLNPPMHPSLILCSDKFSNYYNAQGVAFFRMLGNLTIDSVSQVVSGSIEGHTIKSLVSWPQGSQVSALKFDNILDKAYEAPYKSSSFKVVFPKDTTDSLVSFVPEPGERNLVPLNSEDYRGMEIGSGICAFCKNQGGVYLAGNVLTDAGFVASIPLENGSHYLFVQNATSLDWKDNNVFSSKTPISCEIIFEFIKGKFNVTSLISTAPVTVFDSKTLAITKSNDKIIAEKTNEVKVSSSLVKGDFVGTPQSYRLSNQLTLVSIPCSLGGAYEVSLSVAGEKGKAVSFRMGGKAFTLICGDRKQSSIEYSTRFLGSTSAVLMLEDGAKVRKFSIKLLNISNGGLESWKSGKPEGFQCNPDSIKILSSSKKVAEGKTSLYVALASKQSFNLSFTTPVSSNKVDASAMIFLEEPIESSFSTNLVAEFFNSFGKSVEKRYQAKRASYPASGQK